MGDCERLAAARKVRLLTIVQENAAEKDLSVNTAESCEEFHELLCQYLGRGCESRAEQRGRVVISSAWRSWYWSTMTSSRA
jgi:hypothetical protein